MWHYIKRYLHFAVLAALLMVGEVLADLAQPSLMSSIVDDGVLGGDLGLIATVGLTMVAVAAAGGLCGSLNNLFVNMATKNISNDLRKDLFARAMELSFGQIDRWGAGGLITRITNDTTHIEMLVQTFVRGAIRTLLLMFGSVFFLFQLNPQFGMYLLCAMPVAMVIMFAFLRKARPLFERLQKQMDALNAIMQEDLTGIRTVKACVREVYEKLRFGKANGDLIRTQLRTLVMFAFLSPIMNCLVYGVIAALLWAGNYQVQAGTTTPGVIMASITYATQMLNSMLGVVMLSQDISRGTVSWRRLREVLSARPEMETARDVVPEDGGKTVPVDQLVAKETVQPGVEMPAAQTAAKETVQLAASALADQPVVAESATQPTASALAGRVEFRGVGFAYPEAASAVLHDVNFAIEPGQTVAIMGATGSGKSTLVDLIPRFYDATAGSVLVGGRDVRTWDLHDLRDHVAIALQTAQLTGASVADNLRLGREDATDEQLREALRIAQAADFVDALPQGSDTVMDAGGTNLSGGQRQRVSLARAILRARDVLILDDATSALDLQTEARFYQALREARPGLTKIIVAQRVASVLHADAIVVLDEGTVSAVGTHEELLGACPIYQDIYESQMGPVEQGVSTHG